MGTDIGYDASKDESIKLVVPDPAEQPPSQEAIDRAVFEHNTAVAEAQLKVANQPRRAIVPVDPDADKGPALRFNIEPAVAKTQLKEGVIEPPAPVAAAIENAKTDKGK